LKKVLPKLKQRSSMGSIDYQYPSNKTRIIKTFSFCVMRHFCRSKYKTYVSLKKMTHALNLNRFTDPLK
jgi:hypothetical protein